MKRRLSLTCMCLLFALFLPAPTLLAEDDPADKFEGAIWTFTLAPRVREDRPPLSGAFRVNRKVLYQKDKPADPDLTKEIGKCTTAENGKAAKLVFDDLRVKTAKNRFFTIKGEALLVFETVGVGSGMFTDGMGRNWDMTVKRVQE